MKSSGAKVTGAQDNQETGGKGDKLMDEKKMDNMVLSDMIAGQNMAEGNRRKSYFEVMMEKLGGKRRCLWDSIVRKTDKVLHKGDDFLFAFQGQNRGYRRKGGDNHGSWQGRIYSNSSEREGTTAIVKNTDS